MDFEIFTFATQLCILQTYYCLYMYNHYPGDSLPSKQQHVVAESVFLKEIFLFLTATPESKEKRTSVFSDVHSVTRAGD